jgi:hypothetical protein
MPPIACTLSPGEHRERLSDLSALAARALRSRRPIAGGERLTFADDPATDRELRAAITAEAACCPFLRMELARRAGGLVLDVTGPDGAEPLIASLFAGGRG